MLRIQTLVDKLGKEYEPMINQIKIAEFTKTIAQFSNIPIDKVPDEVIEEYLTHWAKNKYRFFKMLGNRTKVDMPFNYIDENKDEFQEMRNLIPDYPAYAPWLYEFAKFKNNKIDMDKFNWRNDIMTYLDQIVTEGSVRRVLSNMAVTTFFKRILKAPEDMVTKIGRIYENEAIDATYTISIDPVDMMMASENPYNWVSCYRLENMEDSHADGCLAAVLDTTSLITYVWNNKGKYNLYGKYDMKEIRYYRMRQWLNISEHFTTLHFCEIYPGKSNYSDNLHKRLRDMAESYVAKAMFPDCENIWSKTNDAYIDREWQYGYGEFGEYYMWNLKGQKSESMHPYNVEITCPCGCGGGLLCTDDNYDGVEYNGNGLIAENFEERYYCELADDYCSSQECEYCAIYNREHATCELTNEYCENYPEAEDNGNFDPDDTNIVSCGDHCDGCPLYKLHHPEENEDDNEEVKEAIQRECEKLQVEPNPGIASTHDEINQDVIITIGEHQYRFPTTLHL